MSISNPFKTIRKKIFVALLALGLIAACGGCVYLWLTRDHTVISDDWIQKN